MDKMKKKTGYRSVLDFALHCAIRRSLKSVPGFLAGAPGLVILIPPEGRSPAEFINPVADEFYGDEWGLERKYCGYMVATASDKRENIIAQFESECRSKVRAIIIAETELCVPPEFLAAADAILVIDRLSPSDLAAACREVLDVEATEEQAAEALAFPEAFLLASLRPRRAMSDVLRRLHAAPPPV